MKRLILCLICVFCMAQLSNPTTQNVQQESLYLGTLSDSTLKVAAAEGPVVILSAGICDSGWNVYDVIDYPGGQTWYLVITVVNTATAAKTFKMEYELRYNDGSGRYFYLGPSTTLAARTSNSYRVNVNTYVAKLGVMTVIGRVTGAAMGNDNKVDSHVYVY